MGNKSLDLAPIEASLVGTDPAPWKMDHVDYNMYVMAAGGDGMVADRGEDDEAVLRLSIEEAQAELKHRQEKGVPSPNWAVRLVARIRGAGRDAPMVQNLKFIAAARGYVPQLIWEVKHLRSEVARLQTMNADLAKLARNTVQLAQALNGSDDGL